MFKNKEGKLRSGWKIAFVMAIALALSLLISLLIGIIISTVVFMSGNYSIASGSYMERVTEVSKGFNPLFMLIQEVVTIAVPLIAWRYVMKRPFTNMGIPPIRNSKKDFITGLLFGIVSISLVFLALILSGNAAIEDWTPHFSIQQLIYLVIFIFVGFAEEILGRGYIMSVLRQTKNVPAVMIISAVIFSLLHSSNNGIGIVSYINLALVGILFSYMYLRSGNIWMCIGYHITWNYFQGYIFGFKVSGIASQGIWTTSSSSNNIWNGGAFGPEGGLFVTAIILVGFLFVRYYYRALNFDFLGMDHDLPTLTKPNQSAETIPSNAIKTTEYAEPKQKND